MFPVYSYPGLVGPKLATQDKEEVPFFFHGRQGGLQKHGEGCLIDGRDPLISILPFVQPWWRVILHVEKQSTRVPNFAMV